MAEQTWRTPEPMPSIEACESTQTMSEDPQDLYGNAWVQSCGPDYVGTGECDLLDEAAVETDAYDWSNQSVDPWALADMTPEELEDYNRQRIEIQDHPIQTSQLGNALVGSLGGAAVGKGLTKGAGIPLKLLGWMTEEELVQEPMPDCIPHEDEVSRDSPYVLPYCPEAMERE